MVGIEVPAAVEKFVESPEFSLIAELRVGSRKAIVKIRNNSGIKEPEKIFLIQLGAQLLERHDFEELVGLGVADGDFSIQMKTRETIRTFFLDEKLRSLDLFPKIESEIFLLRE